MAKFTIYAALREDMNEGWVWLGGHNHLPNRSIIKLTNSKTSRHVFCEICKIEDKKDGKDGNFIRSYNRKCGGRVPISDEKSALVISEWYRKRLGVEKDADVEIDVTAYRHFGRIRACLCHPQNVVRVATWLGIIGVILGILPLIEPFESLIVRVFKSLNCH